MVRLRFLHSTFFMKICANFINQMSVNSQYPSRKQTRNVCNFDITLLLCYTHCTFQYVFLCCGVERESSRCWCVVVSYECNEEKGERVEYVFAFYDIVHRVHQTQNDVESINRLILSSLPVRIV